MEIKQNNQSLFLVGDIQFCYCFTVRFVCIIKDWSLKYKSYKPLYLFSKETQVELVKRLSPVFSIYYTTLALQSTNRKIYRKQTLETERKRKKIYERNGKNK